ncbi:MAG: hypothetical protein ACLU37_03120 [Collinsella sp.]
MGDTTKIDPFLLESMDVVERVQRVSEPFKRANRKFHPEDSVIDCGHGVKIGGDQFQSSPVPAPSRARTSSASHAA